MRIELMPDQRIMRGPVLTCYTNPSQSAALPTELSGNIKLEVTTGFEPVTHNAFAERPLEPLEYVTIYVNIIK